MSGAIWAPIFAVVLWSGNVVVTKVSVGAFAAGAMAFYRWAFAVLLMTPVVGVSVFRNRKEVSPHLLKLAILGLLGMVMYQGLAYFAAQTTSATNMGIITSLIPLATVVLNTMIVKEVPTLGALLGGIISFFGILFLIAHGNLGSILNQGVGQGDLLMLLASISYGLYNVLLKKWAIPLARWQMVYVQACFGAIFLFPVFWLAAPSPITLSNLPIVLYAGVAASLIAPYLWMMGLQALGANRTSIFMNLLPVVTAMIAIVALGESFEHYHAIGGGLTLLGVILAQVIKKPLLKGTNVTPVSTSEN